MWRLNSFLRREAAPRSGDPRCAAFTDTVVQHQLLLRRLVTFRFLHDQLSHGAAMWFSTPIAPTWADFFVAWALGLFLLPPFLRLALALSWLGLASFRLPLTFCVLLGLSTLAPSAWPLPTFMPSPGSFLPPWPSWPSWSEFELLRMFSAVAVSLVFGPASAHSPDLSTFRLVPFFAQDQWTQTTLSREVKKGWRVEVFRIHCAVF